ncbi:hypothetical protein EVG20_g7849 [Dentipellis fragilis]|uniref:Fungal-type protein kinase domain-containing protein n=1 Tax=Dentipellis fragilis TaxID=205917 RepID=A0A4Y9Y9N2_9AGAM|nr:hypothetical protein EVG20_g7849 [Dentipellis fragilis]
MPSVSIPSGTPVKHKASSNSPITDFNPLPASDRYVVFANEMTRQFLGPMPVQDFLDAFLPKPPTPRPTDIEPFDFEAVKGFETKFAQAAMRANICPNFEFHDTTDIPDKTFPYSTKPDISIIPKRSDASELPNTNWTNIQLFIERKPHSSDPFHDPAPGADRKEHQFVKTGSKEATKSRGQMIAYASAQLTMQFRQFCFSMSIINGDEARLMRWDRGGAIVSERFNFVKDPAPLLEFFWRFNHLSPEQRGMDPSVSPATAEEVAMAVEAKIAAEGDPVHKMHIKNDADKVDHYYLVSRPTAYSIGVCGRSTRGYIAMDMETKGRVWLKDSWRIDTPEMPKEFKIYEKLREKKVSNVPKCHCGGDIGKQKTRTHEFQDSTWRCGKHRIMPHHHYRLALEVIVGHPLHKYKSTKELCVVILDALIALGEAYSLADILHRDVSGGNILITEEGRGVLIDWDLSKEITAADTARADWRTGTWRFMSIGILREKPKKEKHEHCDDLESIFWLLVFNILRYQPNVAKVVRQLNDKLQQVFDSSCEDEKGRVFGGEGKIGFVYMSSLPDEDLQDALHTSLAGLLQELRRIFFNAYMKAGVLPEEVMKAARNSLRNMNAICDVFRKWLAEGHWPEDDAAVDPRWKEGDGTLERKGRKRLHAATEDDEGYAGSGQSTSKRSKKSGNGSLRFTSISQAASSPSLPQLPE